MILKCCILKPSKLKDGRVEFDCPSCEKTNYFRPDGDVNMLNCTADCSHCGNFLKIEDRKVFEFNPLLSEESGGAWPADGQGTGYIEI